MLALTVLVSSTVPRTVHVVGVECWIVPNWNVAQVVVLCRVTATVTWIILGNISRQGWRKRRSGPNKTPGTPIPRGVVATTVSAARLADKAGVRMFSIRLSIFDIFGVEREARGVDQEALSIAPAHERSHSDDTDDQYNQSKDPKDRPNKGFIFEEGLSLGF